MTGWRRSAAAGLLLLAVYVGLSFLNSPRGFLGTDTGGKVATLRVMTEAGRFDPDLGYWAERWDPEGALHPLGYTSHTSSGKWVNVTTLPALWVGWQLYRVGGYRAALLVPMLGAVAAAYAGRALLRRLEVGEREAWWGFWLLGLASPLTVYALDFWEHTLGVALMAWAVVLLADVLEGRPRASARAAGAGFLFGASATMRTETLVYLAAAGLAWAILSSVRRVALGRMAGRGLVVLAAAAVPVVANEALERAVIGSAIRSGRVAGTALTAADAPGSRLREAAMTLFGLQGTVEGIVIGFLAVALLVFAVRRSRADTGLAVVATAGAAVLFAVRFVGGGLGFVPGLAPAWVLPAAAVGRRERERRPDRVHRAEVAATSAHEALDNDHFRSANAAPEGRADHDRTQVAGANPHDAPNDADAPAASRRFVLATAVGAAPIVLATQFRGGAAPQWAGRYLLTTGFLLAVVGWATLTRHRSKAIQAAFAALAVAVTATGVTWLAVRSHDVARTVATLDHRPEPVIVSGLYHLAREGGATYGDHRWLTLSPGPAGRPAGAARVLTAADVDTFVSVEPDERRPLTFPGFTPAGTSDLRLFDGVDLRVTTWRRAS